MEEEEGRDGDAAAAEEGCSHWCHRSRASLVVGGRVLGTPDEARRLAGGDGDRGAPGRKGILN